MDNIIKLTFAAPFSSREITPEGYLKGVAGLIRPGVLPFVGSELGLDNDDIYGVYFPQDVVFSEDTKASAALKPVTNDHPTDSEWVSAANYHDISVGHIGDDFHSLDNALAAGILVTDQTTIDEIDRGKKETSIGFDVNLVAENGQIGGDRYQYRVLNPLNINHLAVVAAGRAGPTVRIMNERIAMTDEEQKLFNAMSERVARLENQAALDNAPPAPAAVAVAPVQVIDEEKLGQSMVDKIKAMFDGIPNIRKVTPDEKDVMGEKMGMEDMDDDDDEDEKKKKMKNAARQTAEEIETSIRSQAEERAMVMFNAQPFLPQGTALSTMGTADILRAALGDLVANMPDASVDYMKGQLDAMTVTRQAATEYQTRLRNSAMAGAVDSQNASDDMTRYQKLRNNVSSGVIPMPHDSPAEQARATAHREMTQYLTNAWKDRAVKKE